MKPITATLYIMATINIIVDLHMTIYLLPLRTAG
jgi:hypothetical protein